MRLSLNTGLNNSNERTIFLWIISMLLPLLIVKSLDFPVNVDELLHYPHAEKVIEWYHTAGADTSCLDTPFSNLKYYGQSVDNLSALINSWIKPVNEYTIRHIIGAFFGWLLVLFTALTAREITGRYRTAIGAGILILLIPSLMGQYCNNLKDIPFAAGYAFAIFSLIRFIRHLPKVPWKYSLQLAVSIAFLISVRVGGLILFPYLFLFLLLWVLIQRDFDLFSPAKRRDLLRLLLQLSVIVILGYLGGLIFWPYGLNNPITHPLESLSLMEHYSISIRQIFQGNWIWSTSLPGYYLLVWMMISIPEIILLGLLFYLLSFVKRPDRFSLYEFIILFVFLFPLIYVILIDSNLYSGWRQMYFLAVPLVILSVLGIERILALLNSRRAMLTSLSVLLVIAAMLPVLHYFRYPDTSYIYFNQMSGGNKNAWSDFEYDYYWHGMKKAAEWFDENIPEDGTTKTIASNFDVMVYFHHRPDIKFKYVHFSQRSKVQWDYGIFGANYIHPLRLKNNTWEPGHIQEIIMDTHNPLALIIKRKNSDDFQGINSAKAGNYQEAIPFLSEAISDDANNYVLYEYLAASYYYLMRKEDCLATIKQGRKIHPRSDRLNMIAAQLEYDSGDYNAALQVCLEIIDYNSKYIDIVPLLIACYEKTGDEKMALRLRKKYNLVK